MIYQVRARFIQDVLSKLDRAMPRTEIISTDRVLSNSVDAISNDLLMTDLSDPDLVATRRNVFDNDEFDVFAHGTLDKDKVVTGKEK